MKHQTFPIRRAQTGISLVVVLILLLVMTLLGLAVLRGTLMEERMSSNLLDRSLGFQAAEAGLREGEALAALQVAIPATGSGCVAGMCEAPTATSAERWRDTGFGGWRTTSATVSDMAAATQFYVEYLGSSEGWLGCNDLGSKYAGSPICVRPVYRVTARSQDAGRASVILQSNFVAP